MKNTSLTRQQFAEITISLAKTIQQLADSWLQDDEVYDMICVLIKSYLNTIIPVKEEQK